MISQEAIQEILGIKERVWLAPEEMADMKSVHPSLFQNVTSECNKKEPDSYCLALLTTIEDATS